MSQKPIRDMKEEKNAVRAEKLEKRRARANSWPMRLSSHVFAAAIVGGLATAAVAPALQDQAVDTAPATLDIAPE